MRNPSHVTTCSAIPAGVLALCCWRYNLLPEGWWGNSKPWLCRLLHCRRELVTLPLGNVSPENCPIQLAIRPNSHNMHGLEQVLEAPECCICFLEGGINIPTSQSFCHEAHREHGKDIFWCGVNGDWSSGAAEVCVTWNQGLTEWNGIYSQWTTSWDIIIIINLFLHC